jgi:hypothetical protein
MPDTLFGIDVPEYTPTGVFPFDCNFNLKRTKKWDVKSFRFSPVIEQYFQISDSPLYLFEIGLQLRGVDQYDEGSQFAILWDFFNLHMGKRHPFYWYDPVTWAALPYNANPALNYRDNPLIRINHATPDAGRYICNFDDDEISYELFEWKLRKANLKMSGVPG